MPISKEKIEQIRKDAEELYSKYDNVYEALRRGYRSGATAEAELTQCLIEALEKIAYGYDNDDSRPGVHMGYSGAQSIAAAALQSYTNSLK